MADLARYVCVMKQLSKLLASLLIGVLVVGLPASSAYARKAPTTTATKHKHKKHHHKGASKKKHHKKHKNNA